MDKRDYSIDVSRGIACLLVVVGHVPTTPSFLHTWIYSFHMPLFFIISGIVLNTNDSVKEFIKKRVKTLLVPYFLLNISVWLIETISKLLLGFMFSSKIDYQRITDGLLGVLIGFRLTNYYYILWFVIALFFGVICARAIVQFLKDDRWIAICGVGLIVANAILWKYVKGMPFSIDMIPLARGVVLLGFTAKSILKQCEEKKACLWGFPLLALNAVIAVIASNYYGDVDLYNCQIGGIGFSLINSLIGSCAIILISKIITRNRWIEFLSANSLAFYAFQNKLVIPAFDKAVKLADRMILNNCLMEFEWVFACIGSITVLSIISIIINKVTPWMVGKHKTEKK